MTVVYSVGHGNRSFEEFAGLLGSVAIVRLVDVRRFPASKRHPHFSRDAFAAALGEIGVAYEWRGSELGGRRAASPEGVSPHIAWRNDSFRAYADHMETEVFRRAAAEVLEWAETEVVAIMCAERLWWNCHRRLISDALVVAGAEVVHLLDETTRQNHSLHEAARVENGGRIVYDVGVTGSLLDG